MNAELDYQVAASSTFLTEQFLRKQAEVATALMLWDLWEVTVSIAVSITLRRREDRAFFDQGLFGFLGDTNRESGHGLTPAVAQ